MSAAPVLVACLAIALASGSGQAPGRWLGVFTPFKGARVLCNQHVLGSSTAQDRVEIAFTLYATTTPTADVIRFYATAHEQTVAPDATTVAVKLENARKVLRVVRAVDHYPGCGVDPRPDEPTVIIVSELTSG